ncbi:selenocysteine-specific elongation factor-like isoform X1 [Octopus sinensis]|uniref:Selenocysteine-specific elongation factor n=2 Tax=Octopus sinensis TaxID=2607531 RepID=A0A6P7SRS9_9MOLL|nr:selenocysteine-specific elongation factor-like isoform X1 [Octopus sinensis]
MSLRTFNFNVGVLGHVDSGKTSLSKILSTTASTACFDKNPQSKERGITLDLGFSSAVVDIPAHLAELTSKYERLQFTFVDCPGHASLIRTIIGGAQIIDLMILVVDITKGIQTQTAECLVVGEIACEKMVVVLNKTDLLPPAKKAATIEKMTKRLLKTLEPTKFAKAPVIAVSANPGGTETGDTSKSEGIVELLETLKKYTYIPERNLTGPFIFSVDHCFSIRGQGTVMTGTVLNGSVSINETIEIPSLKVTKNVKSMQMFRLPVEKVVQGDRAGICVTQFDPKQLERGLVCSPGSLPTIYAGIIFVKKIPYYKGTVSTNAKFHITMGHETIMAHVTFFGTESASEQDNTLDLSKEYNYQEELLEKQPQQPNLCQYALLEFEKPITCLASCLVIGSKLDSDINANVCRIAFHGQLLTYYTDSKYKESKLSELKIFKIKSREGRIERVTDAHSLIGKDLFKKETNIQAFANLKVTLSSGENGIIEGSFGQSGKVKIRIPNGLSEEVLQRYSGSKKKGKTAEAASPGADQEPVKIILSFKRYIFDPKKKMIQS